MTRSHRPYFVFGALGALAIGGWLWHSVGLTLLGAVALLSAALIVIWHRHALQGVDYQRTLSANRAMFGDVISVDMQFVNDKLLPLSWLEVLDVCPSSITMSNATRVPAKNNRPPSMVNLVALLPFQRLRRRFTVTCDQRGLHAFGPSEIRTGDPFGYRDHWAVIDNRVELLVYPKIFQLEPQRVAARAPLGDVRIPRLLFEDPSHIAGVREYRDGDPLRQIDWRATARSSTLLVREFERTTSSRTTVFADLRLSSMAAMESEAGSAVEFSFAVVASVLSAVVGQGIPTGLFTGARVHGEPISCPPSNHAGSLAEMLELLARASVEGAALRPSLAELLLKEGPRLRSGSEALLVAERLDEATLMAVNDLRRKLPVRMLWIRTEQSPQLDSDLFDELLVVDYNPEWVGLDVLNIQR